MPGWPFTGSAGAAAPLRLFDGERIQARLEQGDWVSGVLHVVPGGIEIVYDEPRLVGGCVESSRLLDHDAAARLKALVRPASLETPESRRRRDAQLWRTAHPGWRDRLARWGRELIGRDPVAADPLLRRYLGRRVLVRLPRRGQDQHTTGLLLAYDHRFLALADVLLPCETCLPLCPGTTRSAELDALWNDAGLELFNRGAAPVDVLGVRTSAGMRPWEIVLRPGARERIGFRRGPAGTAELVYERPERGDAVVPRGAAFVLGGSEGTVTLPALPDASTRMGDLPIGTTPESREEPPVPIPSGD